MTTKKTTKKLNNFSAKQMESLREMEDRTKKLARRFWAGIFATFIIAGAGIFFISIFYYNEMAKADLNSGYSKSTGGQLTAADWNSLKNDFVNKSGDTMAGDLTVNGDVCANGRCLSQLSKYNCPTTADFESTAAGRAGTSATNYYVSTATQITAAQFSKCLTEDGCVIKRELTNSSGIISTGYWNYNQDTADNSWSSDYNSNDAVNVNGNSAATRIIPPYNKPTGSSYTIELKDDSGIETSNQSWSVRDASTKYGIKLYICTY